MTYKLNRLGQFVKDESNNSYELMRLVDKYCRMNGLQFIRPKMLIFNSNGERIASLENHHSKMYFKDFVNHKAGFLKNEIDVKLFVNNLLL